MIDFRYHLVSLVAVFLALAVGIALGAGPLREGVADTLESQVQELREERTALREELTASQRHEQAKEALIGDLTPSLTTGRLLDVRVATVLLPGAPSGLAETTADSLEQAGAVVVSRATVPDWGEEDLMVTWQEALEELRVPADGEEAVTPERLLAEVLSGTDAPGDTTGWARDEERLVELGLLEVDRDQTTAAPGLSWQVPDAVVVISGGVTAAEVQGDPEEAPALRRRLDLVAALGEVPAPALVVAAGTEGVAAPAADLTDPLVSAVRDSRAVRRSVSTVDNGEGTSGQLALVLALTHQMMGEIGHYGLGTGADAYAPDVPPGLVPAESTPVTGPSTDPQDQDQDPVDPTGGDDPADPTAGDDPAAGDDDATVTTEAPAP